MKCHIFSPLLTFNVKLDLHVLLVYKALVGVQSTSIMSIWNHGILNVVLLG